MIITRAADVHLRCWLVHSAAFFKTKLSKTLPMLKSSQIKVFWHLKDVNQIPKIAMFQKRRRPQGGTLKKEIANFQNRRRPQGNTLKREIVNFQNPRRPQGNIAKMGNPYFQKIAREK